MKVTKTLENKIGKYIEYSQKAIKIREEITELFKAKGIDGSEEDTEMNLINDMLIDGSVSGDIESTITQINIILENNYSHIK